MSNLFKNKYRIPSARLQTWDYGNPGMYFVTICTQNRECNFGDTTDEQIQLTELGIIAETEWIKTTEIRPDMNLELGEFVIMSNHMHGIIIIGENEFNTKSHGRNAIQSHRDAMHGVSTTTTTTDKTNINKPTNHFAPQSKNLASIIRGYKSSVTIYSRKNNIQFDGNPGFTTTSSGQ